MLLPRPRFNPSSLCLSFVSFIAVFSCRTMPPVVRPGHLVRLMFHSSFPSPCPHFIKSGLRCESGAMLQSPLERVDAALRPEERRQQRHGVRERRREEPRRAARSRDVRRKEARAQAPERAPRARARSASAPGNTTPADAAAGGSARRSPRGRRACRPSSRRRRRSPPPRLPSAGKKWPQETRRSGSRRCTSEQGRRSTSFSEPGPGPPPQGGAEPPDARPLPAPPSRPRRRRPRANACRGHSGGSRRPSPRRRP